MADCGRTDRREQAPKVGALGDIENVGGILSDCGCPQGRTDSRISLLAWWNRKNRILMFPVRVVRPPGSEHDETPSLFQFDAEVCSLSQAGLANKSNGFANAFLYGDILVQRVRDLLERI